MATDRINIDEENSQVSKNAGSIDSDNQNESSPQYQYPHNSRFDEYSFLEVNDVGYLVKNDDEQEAYKTFIKDFAKSVDVLLDNPKWTTLLKHFPIEGFDTVLPQSPYYNPGISITEYIAYAAYIFCCRYKVGDSDFRRLDLTVTFLEYEIGYRIARRIMKEVFEDESQYLIIGEPSMHLVLIIAEYFCMRSDYGYHFHPSYFANLGIDISFFDTNFDEDFKNNPEVKALWDDCIAVAGEPKEVSLSERLQEIVFDPIYYHYTLRFNTLFQDWHNLLIRPIRQIAEKLFAEHIEDGPYRQLYASLKFVTSFYDTELTNERIINYLKGREKKQLSKELDLIVLFFKMCCMNDNRRHVIKYYMQDSTQSLIKDLEEIVEIILKCKDDYIFDRIYWYDDIHEFVRNLKASYHLSHLDEEIVPDKPSFSAFGQSGQILIAPDFVDLPKEDDFQLNLFAPNIALAKDVLSKLEIKEPAKLDLSQCLGYFNYNFFMCNAAFDGDRRTLNERFIELVSWFVENGVIKNEPSVLNLFAYRLTGMGEKPKELPQIEIPIKIDVSGKEAYWTLIYLVKSLYNKNTTRNKDHLGRGIYTKLSKFFKVTDLKNPERADIIQKEFDDIANSRIVDGKRKNPTGLVKGKVPDSLVKLIKDNFGLPQK